jgi:lipid II:glycine glycyltransferase (peptidoglycan interpeptide bridge formation enzyme)
LLLLNGHVLSVKARRKLPDSDWDEFLRRTQGGTYQQSSVWAMVKAEVGWGAVRLVLYHEQRIAGGCQLLVRRLPVAGAIAYVPRGPVMASPSDQAVDVLLNALHHLAREERILYLKLQPPPGGGQLASALEDHGFVPSELEIAPRATTRIDLNHSSETLLRAMHTNARRNIVKARRTGVVVREGSQSDLTIFAALVEETAQRQRFSAYPLHYYEQMWRAFEAAGHVRLFIAEHQGAVIASNLVIGFGDTAIYKMGAWSGERKVPPNELLHVTSMEWARQVGYRYYDLDDISLSAARTVLAGARIDARQGLERFKLGLGGEVLEFPGPYDTSVHPLLGAALGRLAPQAERLRPLVDRILGRGASSTKG